MIWLMSIIMLVLAIVIGAILYAAIGPLALIWNLAAGIFLGALLARSAWR